MTGNGYSHISTYLRGRFRVLNGPNDPAYAQLDTLPTGPTREEFMATSPLPETVNQFLYRLDAKVDAILAGMASSTLEQDFPYKLEVLMLGASGMQFATTSPLSVGDWIEVVILFGQGGFTASGIGNITTRHAGKDGKNLFSLSFKRILEEEREKIIRFVFKEERRQLRQTRLEQE